MEKKMETTIMGYIGIILGLYWGNIGIMEKKMEATIVYRGYIGFRVGVGFYAEGGVARDVAGSTPLKLKHLQLGGQYVVQVCYYLG